MSASKVRGKRLLAVAAGAFVTSMVALYVGKQNAIGTLFFLLANIAFYIGIWQYTKSDDAIPLKWKDRTPEDRKVILIVIIFGVLILSFLIAGLTAKTYDLQIAFGICFAAAVIGFIIFRILWSGMWILRDKIPEDQPESS